MSDFWGLEPIASRMGVHVSTLLRMYAKQRFLMFQVRRVLKPGTRSRRVWYTNDELIVRWQTAQCAIQWKVRNAQRQQGQRTRHVDPQADSVKASRP